MQPDSKGSEVPLPKGCDAEDEDQELEADEGRLYRKLAATVKYLALDRSDLQFAASALRRTMPRPTQRSWSNLKWVGRYLLSHPRVVFECTRVPERDVRRIVGYSDSDWAGCKASRRSVSGGMMTLGGGSSKHGRIAKLRLVCRAEKRSTTRHARPRRRE